MIAQRGSGQAQAAAGSAQADLGRMQSVLNSGSVSAQAALLAPPVRLMPGSGPIMPPGKTIRILPGTLRSSGQFAEARVSDGSTVTLDLRLVQGHWLLHAAGTGQAQTRAAVTPRRGSPASAQLTAAVSTAGQPLDQIDTRQPVILVHGFGENASYWDKAGMTGKISSIPGVWVSAFNYGPTDTWWVDDPANGPALRRCVPALRRGSRPGRRPSSRGIRTADDSDRL